MTNPNLIDRPYPLKGFSVGNDAGIEIEERDFPQPDFNNVTPFGPDHSDSVLDAYVSLYNTLALKLTCQQCGGRGYTTSVSDERGTKTPCVCTLEARAVLEAQADTYRASALVFLAGRGVLANHLSDDELQQYVEVALYGGEA